MRLTGLFESLTPPERCSTGYITNTFFIRSTAVILAAVLKSISLRKAAGSFHQHPLKAGGSDIDLAPNAHFDDPDARGTYESTSSSSGLCHLTAL